MGKLENRRSNCATFNIEGKSHFESDRKSEKKK